MTEISAPPEDYKTVILPSAAGRPQQARIGASSIELVLVMRLLLSLLIALALPAYAQHNHGSMPPAAAQTTPLSDGTVKKIDKAAGEVVIQHGQLDSIGMPPMTMAFGVADKTWLNKLKPGDRIRFAAEMKGGNAIVSRYEMAK